ncbi:MAG: type II secretion system F family protein [Armatimonadota bacterium]|nr:type II secretion system F family protein [Armatimonadota bacterium]
MPAFSYSAKDKQGKTIIGTMEANSVQEVARALREQNLLPQRISAHSVRRNTLSFRNWLLKVFLGPPLAAQMFLYKQLGSMLYSGMSLSQALTTIVDRGRNKRLQQAIIDARDHVMAGGKLSEALGRYPWLFGGLQLSLIEAGESSGMLDKAMAQISGYLDKEIETRRKLSGVTFYPKAAVLLAFVILKLPLPFLVEALGPLRHLPEICIGIGLALWITFKLAMQIPEIAIGWDGFKLYCPGIGSMVHKLALVKFARATAALYSAGLPIARCIETAAAASGNAAIGRKLATAAPALRDGVDIYTALTNTGALTYMVQDMVSTGQMTGNLDEMMQKVAEYYEAEADASMGKLMIIVLIGTLLAAAALAAVILITFYINYHKAVGL